MNLPRADDWTDPGSMDRTPRRGRRSLAKAGLILLALVGSFLVLRATSLRGIPDIGNPFDTATFGTIEVAKDENAFAYYRAAVAKFKDNPTRGNRYLSWAQALPKDREWLFANADAMELWFEGTTRDRAVDHQPKDLRIERPFEVVPTLRQMIGLVQLVGLRMEGEGEPDEAWSWYRAGLRCSRHCGMDGTWVERLIGVSMYGVMANAARAWADNPNQSVSGLRRALDDVVAIDAMTVGIGRTIRAEYFAFSKILEDPDLSLVKIDGDLERNTANSHPSPFDAMKESAWRLVLREPERSRRVLRLVWANWLSVAEFPLAERMKRGRKLAHGYFYDPPADAPEPVRRMNPEAIDHLVGSTLYLRAILPAIDNLERAEARDQAQRAALVVDLAERLYTRENGHPPESFDRLVGPYLKAIPEGFVRPSPASPPSPE